MRAVVRDRYGSPDVLELGDIDKPKLLDDGVLVRVRAAAINPVDWYALAGRPVVGRVSMGAVRPKERVLGVDFAGTVEAAGKDTTGFVPGDEVFGARNGSLADYVCVRVGVVQKPANVSFEQAAGVPVAALTALQGLRDKGRLQPGQKVLVNGASGGVGTFAVQIAKALGAEVTGVCSTANVELVRSLGADRVVDYTCDDFTRHGERHDVLFDVAGSRSWSACSRVLTPEATLVIVGAPKGSRLLGPLGHIVRKRLASIRGSQKCVFFISKVNRPDLELIRGLIEDGRVTPVVDRTYELSEVAEAFRYLGQGHARGKVVVTL